MLILGLGFFGPRPAHAVSSASCTPTADFEVLPDPSTLTLQAGATGGSIVTVTPVNGFSQTINLATSNVPTGLTVTLSATTLDVSAGPATFSLTVKASLTIAAPGDYSFDVNATTSTTLFHDRTIIVHVPTAELGITPSKSFVIITQGSTDTETITLESLYGLPSSTVALTEKVSTTLPSPTAPTVSLTPATVSLSSAGTATSTLTITTSSATPKTTPGEYSIEVNGTASPGSQFNSTKITVDVTTPTFILFAMPASLMIPVGSSDHSTINVTSINSFTGTVALTAATVLPVPGLMVTLSVASVTVPAGSFANSVVTIDVGAPVFPGTYPVLVTGMSGSISRPTEVIVIVPGAATPGYSVTGSPDTLTVPQTGMTSTSAITLASLHGFADTVDLSVYCLPDGLTADITPASVTLAAGGTGSSTLTVSASSFTVPGNYTVSVSGLGASLFVYNYTSVKVVVTGPDFSLATMPSILYMTPGTTATSTVTATSKLGFYGSIKLDFSVSSLSSTGLTASLSKATLNPYGSTDSATLTLTATAIGSYLVSIKGTSWPLVHTTGVYVEVKAPTADFSLAASPASLTIVHGSTKTSTIGLTPLYGFTSTVSLTATGPTGITATPSPLSISGTATATLTVSVGSTVVPGSYTVDVMGTSGTLVHHATIALTVTSTAPTPDFTISATPTVSFTSGTTGTSTVSVTAVNGFYGYVALTSSTPSGLTATFSPTPIYPGTSTATFSSSTPGSYTVTITGTSGSLVHTTNVQVTVTAVGTPDFTITRNPATLTIQAGNSGTSTVTIAPTNSFAGTVALSAAVSPSGPTASLSTSSISGGSGTSTLTVNVASSVAAGTYTVTVQGTSGSLAHSIQVTITVTSVPSTQPTSTAPAIFGLAPLVFYGVVGVVIAVVIGGLAVVIRRKNP